MATHSEETGTGTETDTSLEPSGSPLPPSPPPPSATASWLVVLRWAAALPFFVMPLSLTIDAPDIHGGFAVHLRQALVLALAGAGIGAAVARQAVLARAWEERRWLRRLAAVAVGLPALVAAGHGVAVAGGALADGVGYLLGVLPPGFGQVQDRWGPGLASRLVLVTLAVRAGVTLGGPARLPRLVGLLAAAAVSVALCRFVSFQVLLQPPWLVDLPIWLVSAALAAAWPRLRGRDPSPWLPTARPAVAFAAAMEARPGELAGRVVLGVALVVLAVIGLGASVLLSDALVAVLGGAPSPGLGAGLLRLPAPVMAAAVVLVSLSGQRAGDPAGARRFAGEACWGLTILVLGRSAGLVLGPAAVVGAGLLTTALLLALALRWPVDPASREQGRRWLERGPVVLLTVLGPIGARYVAASLVPVSVPLGLSLLAGAAGGAGLGWWLVARASQPRPPLGPLARAADLALLWLALVLPITWGVALGVARGPALLSGVVLLGLTASPWLSARGAVWGWFYVCFALVTAFKLGPSPADCAPIVADASSILLLDRFGDGSGSGRSSGPESGRGDGGAAGASGYASAEPYDVATPPGSSAVVVSFKRIDKRGGFIEVLDANEPASRTRLVTERPEGGQGPFAATAFWPERLEPDPATGALWMQLIGYGAHAMWELRASGGAGRPTIEVTRRLPIRWEPGHPAIDAARRRMVLSYVPNRAADNPLVEAFHLGTLRSTGSTPQRAGQLQMSDFVTWDPGTGRYYTPAFFGFVRFALFELDGDTLDVLRRVETFHPSVGVVVDDRASAVYLTNPLAGTIEVYEQRSMRRLQSVRAGGFPRDLAFDRDRGLLYVAGYAGGQASVFRAARDGAPRLELLAQHQLGSLLRGVGVDPVSGRAFAASGCGVFELTPGAGAAPSGR